MDKDHDEMWVRIRRLEGKVAIITGASTGLGPVMGAMFVREGARVLLAARREELVREAAAAAGGAALSPCGPT